MAEKLKKGQVVLFQGDSITDCGRRDEGANPIGYGYASRVAQMYELINPNSGVTFINRGISGNRIKDLLARYETDFKGVNPDFISILIGINDTWRRYDRNDPTSASDYERDYRILLERIKSDMPHTKIMIMEPFVLNSLPDRANWREDLDPKIFVARKLAKEYADYYLPLDGIFAKAEVEEYTCNELAGDGVHPSDIGHSIIAKEYIKEILG